MTPVGRAKARSFATQPDLADALSSLVDAVDLVQPTMIQAPLVSREIRFAMHKAKEALGIYAANATRDASALASTVSMLGREIRALRKALVTMRAAGAVQ